MLSERETVVELPLAADCCPCVVEAANRVTRDCVGTRDGVVQLVSILGGVVSSARAGLVRINVSALPSSTVVDAMRGCVRGITRRGLEGLGSSRGEDDRSTQSDATGWGRVNST
jgi:hypothetical protein